MKIQDQVFADLLVETKLKVKRALVSNRVSLTTSDIDLFNNIIELAMRTYKLELEINPPKRSPSLNSINCQGNKVVGYHYVDGIKRQITQITKGSKVYYYTDGTREKI